MSIQVTMPRLSDTMEQGTVVKWNVREGDRVAPGDVLADIETDKATMELQAFDEGVVSRLAVPEGKTVAVGQVILVLNGDAEPAGTPAAPTRPASDAAVEVAPPTRPAAASSAAPSAPAPASEREPERVFASPLARKLAADAGLDLAHIEGTGPSGRITRKDVEAAVGGRTVRAVPQVARPAPPLVAGRVGPPSAPPTPMPAPLAPAPAAGLERRIVPLSNMRAVIARRLVESKTTIPHYEVTVELDCTALVALRAQLNEQLEPQGVRLTVNDFVVRACALAMHEHPFVNSRWIEKGADGQPAIDLLDEVNIGIAIALPVERGGGLVVGVIRHADALGLRQVSQESRRLAEKARQRGLTIEEMEGATFTVSNLGMFGVEHFTAIINPPNVAILALGAAVEVPVIREGRIEPGWRMRATLASDHRVVDGAMAAAYLATVRALLERPATLLV